MTYRKDFEECMTESSRLRNWLAFAGFSVLLLGTSPIVAQDDSLVVAENGNVGMGLENPARQLHLTGPNAVFRMDRSANTASFLMVRTNENGTPLKTFLVGTNAYGVNDGEFIINDLDTRLGGNGQRRMTVANDGSIDFPGPVSALTLTETSSERYKTNVETLAEASALIHQLRGVRFRWKESGDPALGLIAEEVEKVIPEIVSKDNNGQPNGLNYSGLVAVLVESFKEQQMRLNAQEEELSQYRALLEKQSAIIAQLQQRLVEFEAVITRITRGVETEAVAASIQETGEAVN